MALTRRTILTGALGAAGFAVAGAMDPFSPRAASAGSASGGSASGDSATTLARLINRTPPAGSPETCPATPISLAELRFIVEMGRMNGLLRGCGSETWRTHFGWLDLKLQTRADLTPTVRQYAAFVHGLAQGMTHMDDAPRICGTPPSEEGRARVEAWATEYFMSRVAPLAWPTSREDYLRAGVPPEAFNDPAPSPQR